MAFGDFAYPDVLTEFGLTETSADLFESAPDVAPSTALRTFLEINLKLATTGNTAEKARSELLVAPIMSELWAAYHGRISLHSGAMMTGDPDVKLNGYCDFLIGRGPQLPRLVAPLMVVVEAKRDNIENGFGQCIAGMVGVQRFNKRAGQQPSPVCGVITTGMNWRFLRLDGTTVTHDSREQTIEPIERLLGKLVRLLDTMLAAHP